MARNPFWDIAMNHSKFSACLTTRTLENQSFLNQNFVKSWWMSAEGYWFFLNKTLSEKSRKLSSLIKVKGIFFSKQFAAVVVLNFGESASENVYQMFKVAIIFKLKVKASLLLSNSVSKRDKKLSWIEIFWFLPLVRFMCIL